MATEDGVVLAECISCAKLPQDLSFYLEAFEAIRKDRCSQVQSGSIKNEDFWHMKDGPRQRVRDAFMRNEDINEEDAKELRPEGKNPNQWADPKFQPWLFGYDAVAEAKHFLDDVEAKRVDVEKGVIDSGAPEILKPVAVG
jgi:salicylate hydroxylase